MVIKGASMKSETESERFAVIGEYLGHFAIYGSFDDRKTAEEVSKRMGGTVLSNDEYKRQYADLMTASNE